MAEIKRDIDIQAMANAKAYAVPKDGSGLVWMGEPLRQVSTQLVYKFGLHPGKEIDRVQWREGDPGGWLVETMPPGDLARRRRGWRLFNRGDKCVYVVETKATAHATRTGRFPKIAVKV